jgi:hypothetical protein
LYVSRAVLTTREDESVPNKTITCPDCGLVLRVSRNDTGFSVAANVSISITLRGVSSGATARIQRKKNNHSAPTVPI